jgi:hypothetical protein
MTENRWIQISLGSFEKLTGATFDHFAAHVLRGDAWGSFLKMASLIEASSKRAIGLKLGLDPSSDGVGRIEFYSALVLCKETGLITREAYEFANYLRHVRNDLVHKGGILHLDIEQLRGITFFKKYRERVEAFASIQGVSLADGEQQHLNTLLVGCVAYLGLLSKVLFDEDWFQDGAQSASH